MNRELAIKLTTNDFKSKRESNPELKEFKISFYYDHKNYIGIYSKDVSYNADNGGWHFSYILQNS